MPRLQDLHNLHPLPQASSWLIRKQAAKRTDVNEFGHTRLTSFWQQTVKKNKKFEIFNFHAFSRRPNGALSKTESCDDQILRRAHWKVLLLHQSLNKKCMKNKFKKKKDKQMKTYILDGILRRRRRSQGERQRERGSRPLTMSGVWVINSRDAKATRWLMIRVSSETKPQLYSKASPKIPLSVFWHLLTLFTF